MLARLFAGFSAADVAFILVIFLVCSLTMLSWITDYISQLLHIHVPLVCLRYSDNHSERLADSISALADCSLEEPEYISIHYLKSTGE